MRIQKIIETVIAIVIVVAAIVGIAYASYYVNRWWNYTMSYEDMVKKTVCEMVKPEYLKDSSKCNN